MWGRRNDDKVVELLRRIPRNRTDTRFAVLRPVTRTSPYVLSHHLILLLLRLLLLHACVYDSPLFLQNWWNPFSSSTIGNDNLADGERVASTHRRRLPTCLGLYRRLSKRYDRCVPCKTSLSHTHLLTHPSANNSPPSAHRVNEFVQTSLCRWREHFFPVACYLEGWAVFSAFHKGRKEVGNRFY